MEPNRLERLHRSYDRDAELDEAFVVLTLGASLIATLGLLANNAAVVIGAMVVAPWILPLRTSVFAVLLGSLPLLGSALRTLLAGVVLTTVLSSGLGLLATATGFHQFGSEVLARTEPNLLDLGIALAAGAIATYAKLRSDAVSSLAGTAIAVALVPPVCVMGLLLANHQWNPALGAGLLFLTNLLGILTGGIVMMAAKEPFFREQLRQSHLSLVSFVLTGLLVLPLSVSFRYLLQSAAQEQTRQDIERTIRTFLERETLTFGADPSVEVGQVLINWKRNPPLIKVLVRVTNPNLPTYTQISAVQDAINARQPLRYELMVQRTAVVVVGPEEAPNPSDSKNFELIEPAPPEPPAVEPEPEEGNPDGPPPLPPLPAAEVQVQMETEAATTPQR